MSKAMKKLDFKATSLGLFFALVGSASIAATAEEALIGCKGYPDVDRPNTCRAYFTSMLDFIESEDPMLNPNGVLCVDDDTPIAEIIAITIRWIEDNPEQKDIALFHAVHNALSPRFQCK